MGKSTPSPPPVQPVELPEQPDFTPLMSQMVNLMELMLVQEGGTPSVPDLPETGTDEDAAVNWDEQIDQIRTETEAEVREDLERRRGVEDTILTSPLVEYEEPTLLTGGSIVGS